MHKFVLTADIEKMFRQILVHPLNRKYQRVFWYHEGKLAVYEINVVAFGLSSAPYLAVRTLHQLALDEGHKFPLGARILKRDWYVDSLLTGGDSLEEIFKIRDEVYIFRFRDFRVVVPRRRTNGAP